MITLSVEINAGSDITDAFQDAIELSNKLNVTVKFNFNGVDCYAKPRTSIRVGVENYHAVGKSVSKYKIATSY